MAQITVNSTTGLLAALKAAREGDSILLEPGTYSSVVIHGINFANLNIQSKDPARPAVLTDLLVRSSSGLNFSNLEFAVDPAKAINSFQILSSKDIHLDRLNIHGTLDGTPAGDKVGLLIRNSVDVSVTNSEFHQLQHGLAHLDSRNLLFTGNTFHDIRTDGIRGGGSSDVVISKNSFTDFYPADGDHPDAIQFWTTNTTVAASNITVTDNVMTRGNGAAFQGIFMRASADLPFKNVTITDNLVIGGMYNGIAVAGSTNLEISRNTVAAMPDMKSWIRVQDSDLALVSGNLSNEFVFINAQRMTQLNNEKIRPVGDGGAAMLEAWLAGDAPAGGTGSVLVMPPPPAPSKALFGTDGADRLSAVAGSDTTISAGAGNDVITGGAGRNVLIGGTGDDTYVISDGDDVVQELANGGIDTVASSVDYTLTANVEVLRLTGTARTGVGNELDNRLIGNESANQLSGLGGDDRIQGGGGNDVLLGGDGNDELLGQDGDDRLVGGSGADKLIGGSGADRLEGGEGADWLEGGAGADTMSGGSGADRYYFRSDDFTTRSIDTILDFSAAQGDKIFLTAVDANVATPADEKFAFIGTQAFQKKAGELRYEVKNGSAYVYGDTNGDGVADFTIILQKVYSISASDFAL